MGYILPVTNYQYMQYAEREIGVIYEPFHIGKVSKIKKEDPVQKGQDEQQISSMEREHDEERPSISRMQKAATEYSVQGTNRIYKKNVNPVIVSRTFAEITGKGKHYSESI